jgi:hypothetical protein
MVIASFPVIKILKLSYIYFLFNPSKQNLHLSKTPLPTMVLTMVCLEKARDDLEKPLELWLKDLR